MSGRLASFRRYYGHMCGGKEIKLGGNGLSSHMASVSALAPRPFK